MSRRELVAARGRWQGRLAAVAVILAMVACSRDQAETAGLLGCGACVIVSQAGAVVVEQEVRGCDGASCDGRCNPFYTPMRCTPVRGPEGQRCGEHLGQSYECDFGLRCVPGPDGVGVCTP
ncbi:MAG: hypothetical protein K1X94_20620 [Sandaracinaceae bacterium]|nr:hypothetical protein [Sandaracinaceae bacterium]